MRQADLARVRRWRDTPQEYDRALWGQMAELGWLGILVPEEYGGLGLGLTEMALVAQGLARSLAPSAVPAPSKVAKAGVAAAAL